MNAQTVRSPARRAGGRHRVRHRRTRPREARGSPRCSATRTRSSAARWTTRSCRPWPAPRCSLACAAVRLQLPRRRRLGGWLGRRPRRGRRRAGRHRRAMLPAGQCPGGWPASRSAGTSRATAAERLDAGAKADAARAHRPVRRSSRQVPAVTGRHRRDPRRGRRRECRWRPRSTGRWPQALPVIVFPGVGHFFHGPTGPAAQRAGA